MTERGSTASTSSTGIQEAVWGWRLFIPYNEAFHATHVEVSLAIRGILYRTKYGTARIS